MRNHPGGAFGEKSHYQSRTIFIPKNKPEVSRNLTIKDVIISISSSKHGIIVVTDNGNIIGVITDGDLRRMLSEKENFTGISAKDIMSKNPKTIEKEAFGKKKQAMQILKQNNIGQLVVTQQGEYLGIIDLHKLLDEGMILSLNTMETKGAVFFRPFGRVERASPKVCFIHFGNGYTYWDKYQLGSR